MDSKDTTLSLLLNSLRTIRKDSKCDCVIVCGQKKLPAHRLVLSACSPYFNELLGRTKEEESETEIDLPEIEGEVMATILDYMYTGVINNMASNVRLLQAIVTASDFLKMGDLFHISIEYLAEEFSATNIEQLLKLCLRYEDTNLQTKIMAHLQNKLCHLHIRDDFLCLTFAQLKQMFQYLSVTSSVSYELKRALTAWEEAEHKKKDNINDVSMSASTSEQLQISETLANGHNVSKKKEDMSTILTEMTAKGEHSDQALNSTESDHILFFENIDGHSNMMKYNVQTEKLSTWEKFPVDVNEEVITVVHRNHVYFVGGHQNGSLQSSVHDYCLNMNELVATGNLCFSVDQGSAAVLQEEIYVVGTSSEENLTTPCQQRVQRYDVDKRCCEVVAQTNNEYFNFFAFAFNNYLYVADKSNLEPGKLERFDPVCNQWTDINKTFYDSGVDARDYCYNIAFSGSQMFVVGHYAGSDLNTYDLIDGMWRPRIEITNDPNGSMSLWSAMAGSGPILALHDADEFLYIYDIASSKWKRIWQRTFPTFCRAVVVASLQQSHCPIEEQQYQHPLLTSLNLMRKSSILTDVTLICEQQEISAHSFILTNALPYFHSMFSSGFDEAKNRKVNLHSVNAQVMDFVLTFLYTGKLCEESSLEFSVIVQVLEVAHFMDIKELFNTFLKKVTNEINIENLDEIYRIAELYDNQGLASMMSSFLAKNFVQLLQSNEFLSLSSLQLKRILQHPDLDISIEVKYLTQRFQQWYECDDGHTQQEVNELMIALGLAQSPQKQSSFQRVVKNIASHVVKSPHLKTLKLNPSNECIIHYSNSYQGKSAKETGKVTLYNSMTKKVMTSKIISFSLVPGMSAVGFGSCIYFFGGGEDDPEAGTKIYQYCPFRNALLSEDKLRVPVTSSGAGVLGDAIYVVGGDKVQRYVPFSSTCESVSKTNKSYSKPRVFGVKSSVFVLGCSKEKNLYSVDDFMKQFNCILEQYNSLTDQWTILTGFPSEGYVSSISIKDEIINFVLVSNYRRCYYHLTHVMDNYWHDITYDISSEKWSEKQRTREHAPELQTVTLPNHSKQKIVFTYFIKSQFPYPLRVRPGLKHC